MSDDAPSSTLRSLFGLDRPKSDRRRRVEAMNRLAEDVLPARAANDHRYPVRFDHCFKRIAYDAAVGARWDTVVASPFYVHASLDQIRCAYDALTAMAESPAAARSLNRQSLHYRNGS